MSGLIKYNLYKTSASQISITIQSDHHAVVLKFVLSAYIEKSYLLQVDNNLGFLEFQFGEIRCECEDGEVHTENHQPLGQRTAITDIRGDITVMSSVTCKLSPVNMVLPSSVLRSPLSGILSMELRPGHLAKHRGGEEGQGSAGRQYCSDQRETTISAGLEGREDPGEEDEAPQPD